MTDQRVTATTTSNGLGIASLVVAVSAIVAGVFGVAVLGLTLAAIGFGLGIGGAIQNPRAWGYWVAGAIISLAVALRLLI